MARFWSILFALVPLMGVGVFLAGPYYGIWLPKDVSAHGQAIDHLFYLILWITGAVFLLTEVALFWFMWRYEEQANPAPARFLHGSHTLEVVWTIVPAVILLFLAIYQMNAWADAKMRKPDMRPTVEVSARQFEWRLRYPGPNGKLGDQDDLFLVNDLHVPVNEEILISLKSMDVLHSFFLPQLRIKQDAIPGNDIPVWFKPTEIGKYDLVCAELCGWGHYKMKGRLTVESRADFDRWLARKVYEQSAMQETREVASAPQRKP